MPIYAILSMSNCFGYFLLNAFEVVHYNYSRDRIFEMIAATIEFIFFLLWFHTYITLSIYCNKRIAMECLLDNNERV